MDSLRGDPSRSAEPHEEARGVALAYAGREAPTLVGPIHIEDVSMTPEGQEMGGRIADFREAARVSRRELASGIGVDQGTVARIEEGARLMDAAEAVAIADCLGVNVGAVIADEPAVLMLCTSGSDDALPSVVDVLRQVTDDYFAFDRAARDR